MDAMITKQLIETTYIFCYNRLYNKQDAEDLAQEILCEALKAIRSGKNITHFYSWYWKMAHNRYATFLSLRTHQAVSLDTYEGVVATSLALEEGLISQEEYAELNYALSRLGAIHREILILFYLKEYSISAIAEKLSIPIGTVKGRLFDARKNLKERLETMNNTGTFAYAPSTLRWFGGYNACKHDDYMNNLIAQQILILCRMEAKSMTQVGDEMGVAPVYLEHFFHELLNRRLLKEATKGKYLSDICVFPQQPYTYADAIAKKVFLEHNIGKEIVDILYSLKDQILSYNFYGNHFSYEYLMWILIVYACHSVSIHATAIYNKKYENKVPTSNDKDFRITATFIGNDEEIDYSCYENIKSVSWSNIHNHFATCEFGSVEYINDFQQSPFPDRTSWINGNNISLLLQLAQTPNLELSPHAEEMVANFIQQGLVTKLNGTLQVQIPIIDSHTVKELERLIYPAFAPIATKYEKEISKSVEEILLPHVRKDLLEEFVHWNMSIFLQPTGITFQYALWDTGILPKPEDFHASAAGLWIKLHS